MEENKGHHYNSIISSKALFVLLKIWAVDIIKYIFWTKIDATTTHTIFLRQTCPAFLCADTHALVPKERVAYYTLRCGSFFESIWSDERTCHPRNPINPSQFRTGFRLFVSRPSRSFSFSQSEINGAISSRYDFGQILILEFYACIRTNNFPYFGSHRNKKYLRFGRIWRTNRRIQSERGMFVWKWNDFVWNPPLGRISYRARRIFE